MKCCFNRSHRRLYILVDSFEGLDERLVFELIERILGFMGDNDVIDLISLQS
jgi:hypothetical protein